MILLLFICTLCIVILCCFNLYLGISSHHWPATKGTILSAQIIERKNAASSSPQIYYHPIISYEYYVGTKKYISKRESAKFFSYDKGEQAHQLLKEFQVGKDTPIYHHPLFKNIACLKQGLFQVRAHLLLFFAAFIPFISILIGYISGNQAWLIEQVFSLISKVF